MNEHSTIEPALHHQLGDLADAADVLDAVGLGKAEIAVKAVADIVAVEQHGVVAASRCSRCSTMLAMVDLPAPERPVNHTIAGFCFLSAARSRLADQERLPMDVGRRGAARTRSCRRRRCVGDSGR